MKKGFSTRSAVKKVVAMRPFLLALAFGHHICTVGGDCYWSGDLRLIYGECQHRRTEVSLYREEKVEMLVAPELCELQVACGQQGTDKFTVHCEGDIWLDTYDQCDKNQKCADEHDIVCDNRQCISRGWLCDSTKPGCFDGSHTITSEICNNETLHICNTNEFKCKDGTCVPLSLRCDQQVDCIDGSDEIFETCHNMGCQHNPEKLFKCESDGRCISRDYHCDRYYDCEDGSDEKSCLEKPCRPEEFRCSNGQCINTNRVCNLYYDCSDGSDEDKFMCDWRKCQSNEFRCLTGQCIPHEYKCDGRIHCEDGSDESFDGCRNHKCPPKMVKCAYKNQCAISEKYCSVLPLDVLHATKDILGFNLEPDFKYIYG